MVTIVDELEHGTPYVIKKNGMYYGHNSCGYTDSVYLAELYTEEYAKQHAENHDDVIAIKVPDIIIDSDEVQEYLDRILFIKQAVLLKETHEDG